jgi:hypothetical protein
VSERLDPIRSRDYGSAPAVTHSRSPALRLAVVTLAAALGVGCGPPPEPPAGPLDRFTFPVGLAVTGSGELLVTSSNYELEFNAKEGGTVTRVNPASVPAAFSGGVRLSSYGGELAYADAAACNLPRSLALTTSRGDSSLHAYALDDAGGLSCNEAWCSIPFQNAIFTDPFGVAVVCAPGREAVAFVGFLRPVSPDGALGRIRLADGGGSVKAFGAGAPRSFAYDAVKDRLFYTTLGTPTAALIRWIELSGGCEFGESPVSGGCVTGVRDVFPDVRGAELQGIAFSNPQDGLGRRLYVAARLFDPALAAVIGRPAFDIGGALLVFDVEEGAGGAPALTLVRTVSIGLGTSQVAVLPARARRACPERPDGCAVRDLVMVTAADDGVAALYDDEAAAVVKLFGRDPTSGAPQLGRLPYGLAVQPLGAGTARVYVASFDQGFVTPIDVPLEDPGAAALVVVDGQPRRIGQEQP